MKKLVVLMITLIVLTGCGKKIVCKTTDDNTVSEIYKINYKDNNITSIVNEKTYKFDNKDEFESFENLMNYKVESNNTDNIKVSYKKKNKRYLLITRYDVNNLTETQLNEFGLSNNLNNLKDILTGYGLVCK